MSARVIRLAYPTPSEVSASPQQSAIRLALEAGRTPVGMHGKVRDAALLRDAMLTAVAVRDSDLRYKGRDRSAYLAYLSKKGKKATAAIWAAQKAFLEGAYGDETPRPRGLDPVLTVDPDEVSIEVFSRDESAYARLAVSNDLFDARGASHGTTLCDLSPSFVEQVERIRTYQPVEFEADTRLKGTPLPREIDLPDEWMRGFLQVQSAATLPSTLVELAPIDLYNLLFALRVRKAKKPPRGLRFELIPGARPRLVIEPWETTLEAHGPKYQGSAPRIVRIFGRQRLLALAGALPHLRKVQVHLVGPGLPSFWVLDMGLARLTVALTSWAESKWAGAASFDALMPKTGDTRQVDKAVAALRAKGPLHLNEMVGQMKQSAAEVRSALQRACLRGEVLFDIDQQKYRPRALLADPIDDTAIRYGSQREAIAHRLLGDGEAPAGDVQVTKVHVIAGEGQEISGEVNDKQARRSFAPRFTVDVDGQVREAWCNCPTYQRSGMREGPCEHAIALLVMHKRQAAEAERLRLTPEGRKLVRAETRTLVRRAGGSVESIRISLDDRALRVERQQGNEGEPLGEARHQRLWFDTDHQAREAYFSRLDDLGAKGFIDMDAMSA